MRLNATAFTDREAILGRMRALHVPGMTYALLRGGKRAEAGALGVKRTDTGEPMTCGTVFEAASLTKSLFATYVMRMVGEGTLSLDARLASLRAEEGFCADERFAQATVRHALSHGTGLPNWDKKPLPLLFAPGEGFGYSGEGYYYLQRIVEGLCGAGLPALFEEAFFRPWGMEHCAMMWNAEIGALMPQIHDEHGKAIPQRARPSLTGNAPEPNAAWSLYATSGDYALFLEKLLTGGAGLSEAAFAQMAYPVNRAAEGVFWGLGFGIAAREPDVLWHWGDNGGFRSFSIIDRSTGDGAVLFTNGMNGTALCLELLAAETDGAFYGDIARFIESVD